VEQDCPKTVAIIGVGIMGRQVAWACAVHGLVTKIYDPSPEQVKTALTFIEQWFADGSLSAEEQRAARERLIVCCSLQEAVADADLAFENVPEELDLKREVHAEIDRSLRPGALQGSNASSLMCSWISSATQREDRFFCMNFSLPRFGMGYVELMGNPKTSPETLHEARAWARQIKMVPITTHKEIMGYAMNRIWRAVKRECLFLADQGYSTPEEMDRAFMLFFGIDWGPFGLMDRIALDGVMRVEQRYYEHTGDPRDAPPAMLKDMVARGELGEKAGKGFYSWPHPAYQEPDFLSRSEW